MCSGILFPEPVIAQDLDCNDKCDNTGKDHEREQYVVRYLYSRSDNQGCAAEGCIGHPFIA